MKRFSNLQIANLSLREVQKEQVTISKIIALSEKKARKLAADIEQLRENIQREATNPHDGPKMRGGRSRKDNFEQQLSNKEAEKLTTQEEVATLRRVCKMLEMKLLGKESNASSSNGPEVQVEAKTDNASQSNIGRSQRSMSMTSSSSLTSFTEDEPPSSSAASMGEPEKAATMAATDQSNMIPPTLQVREHHSIANSPLLSANVAGPLVSAGETKKAATVAATVQSNTIPSMLQVHEPASSSTTAGRMGNDMLASSPATVSPAEILARRSSSNAVVPTENITLASLPTTVNPREILAHPSSSNAVVPTANIMLASLPTAVNSAEILTHPSPNAVKNTDVTGTRKSEPNMLVDQATKVNLDDAKYRISPDTGTTDKGSDGSGIPLNRNKRRAEDSNSSENESDDEQEAKKKKSKKPKTPTAAGDQEDADDEDMQDRAEREIAAFNKNPDEYKISDTIRKLCRFVPSFAPSSGTSHELLSKEIMTTNRGNAICGYHSINDKRTKNWDTDGNETRPFRCTGVPVVPKKFIKKSDASKEDPSRKGFMNCGCEWKPVLIEFYYLKTGVIRSPTLDYEEGWAAREFLTPRERCLIYGNWEEKTGLRLEDMWRVKEEINPRTGEGLGVFIAEKTEEELLSAQIQVLQERLAQLSVDEDVQEDD